MNDEKILITGSSGFIGTNLIELFEEKGYNFINFDKNKPIKENQSKYWYKGNILDIDALLKAFEVYCPTIVIHLAAKTDTASSNLEDYIENTKGTANVISVIENSKTVKRTVITSTQYVYKNSSRPFPLNDNEYAPHTTYGISKMISEEFLRNSVMKCNWTIIRPTNVWGPWNLRYPLQLWRFMDKGLYWHPCKRAVVRTYAYVKNLTHQLDAIINADEEKINKKTFYLGDLPMDSFVWLSELSMQIRGKKVKHLPELIFRLAACMGDIMIKLHIKFPINSQRFHNMIEDFYAPTNITVREFGFYTDDLSICMKETNDWINGEGLKFFDYWANKK
jgi:GlcNAc-P-P-Und epimerase